MYNMVADVLVDADNGIGVAGVAALAAGLRIKASLTTLNVECECRGC